MVIDYEAAWVRLQALIASKSQHGREATLTAMATIANESRVGAGELSRLLRLYGVEVERISTETDRAELGPFDGGLSSPADRELAGHHGPGGHDGSGNTAGHNGHRSA